MGGNYDNGDNIKSKAMYDAIENKAIKIAAQRVNRSKIRPLTIKMGYRYTYTPTVFQIL